MDFYCFDLEDLPSILIKISVSAFLTGCIFLIGMVAGCIADMATIVIISLSLFGLWVAIAIFTAIIGCIAAIWILL